MKIIIFGIVVCLVLLAGCVSEDTQGSEPTNTGISIPSGANEFSVGGTIASSDVTSRLSNA